MSSYQVNACYLSEITRHCKILILETLPLYCNTFSYNKVRVYYQFS